MVAFPPCNDFPFHEIVSLTGVFVPLVSPAHPPVEVKLPLTILPDVMLTFPPESEQDLKLPLTVTESDPW